MKMYPNSTIPRVRRTQSTTLRPISMRACPRWFVLCRCTGGPPNGEPADPRCRRQQPFATVLLPWQRTQTAEKWFGKPRSVMSLCGPVLLRSVPLTHQASRAISITCQDLVQLTVPGCRVHDLSWLPSLLPRRRPLTLPTEPYDDGRNAVKEKARFGVPAEGPGVHPAACPEDMDTAIDNAPATAEEQVAARRLPENATLPCRAFPACVPDVPFLVGGNRRGNVRASPAPYVPRAWLAAARNVIRRARPP